MQPHDVYNWESIRQPSEQIYIYICIYEHFQFTFDYLMSK